MVIKRGVQNRSSFKFFGSSKKGQVTVFIIVGIFILFTFAGIMYFTKTTVKEKMSAEGEPIIASVPQQFKSIVDYTDGCLYQVGKRGVQILGEQGGYLSPEVVGKFSVSDPTNAEGVDLEPLKVPYWHYNQAPNGELKISFASLQPKLHFEEDKEMSIEAQLQRFIKEKLPICLNDYAAFREQNFELTVAENLEVEARVADESVNLWLKMEVQAKRGEAQQTMNEFYVKLPVKLKHYYEVASEITQVEQNHSFLERQALDLISTYSALDLNKLPPTSAVSFDIIPRYYWNEEDVKQKVTDLLISYVPMMRYLGSTNFYRYDYLSKTPTMAAVTDLRELYQKNYDNMILPLEKGDDLLVSFDYFGWPAYIDLNDKDGRIEPMQSLSVNKGPLKFNTQHYYTTYDLSYPVLVTLQDEDALNGEGYNFVFALEANVRNNRIVKPEEVLSKPIPAPVKSLVCKENQRNTELIKTVVVDSSDFQPVELVQIAFTVPEQDDCLMGATDEEGILETKYPAIYGGVIGYMKEGYLTNFYPIDTYSFKKEKGVIGYAVAGLSPTATEQRVIPLHKFKIINAGVKKKSLEKCLVDEDGEETCFAQSLFGLEGPVIMSYQPQMREEIHNWKFLNVAKPLGDNETVTIIMNRVRDLDPRVANEDYTASFTLTGKGTAEVELVPGMYKVMALLTSSERLVIPKEERCTSGVLCTVTASCCFDYTETVLEKSLTGQLSWDEADSYLTITPEQLYQAEKITFNVLSYDLKSVPEEEHKRVTEDLQVMASLSNFSRQLQEELQPVYS